MTYTAATRGDRGGGGRGGSGGGCDQRRPKQSVLLQLLQQIHFGCGGGCGRTGRSSALWRHAFIDTLMGIVIDRGTRIGRHRGLFWIDTRMFREMMVVVMVLDGVVMVVVIVVMMGHIGWMQFIGKYR